MRNRISGEMWSCLNLSYLRLQEMTIQKIWEVSPEDFYVATAHDIDTFVGVAEVTMYRDEGWRFWRLGRAIERVQSSASLFLAQIEAGRRIDESLGEDWTSLLRFCQAFDAYNRKHSVDVKPDRVLDLLVTDPQLPGSLFRSLDAAVAELDAIGPGPCNTPILDDISEEWKQAKAAELPLGRFGEAWEIAETVAFLAGPGGAIYVGQTLGPNSGDVML